MAQKMSVESNLTMGLIDKINEQRPRIKYPEQLLGRNINQPNVPTTSGSRSILYESQDSQRLELYNGEIAQCSTGYENAVGEHSSSFDRLKDDYFVIAKIPKFKSAPDFHYYLILQNKRTKKYTFRERLIYNYITENFGFLYDTKELDKYQPGNTIPADTVIKKSASYDKYNNKLNGVNLNTTYIACEENKEDAMLISDYAAEKLAAPLVKTLEIVLNENDIPLNFHGDNAIYKCIPDIGEKVKNGIFMGTRTERNSEILYAQSMNRLAKLMMSDEKYTVEGEVVDISICCNNPEFLNDNYSYSQLNYYYQQQQDFVKLFVQTIDNYVDKSLMDYQLQKLYHRFNQEYQQIQFIKDKPFSNIMIKIAVVDKNIVKPGDKITNRYGGKGVVGEIRPRELMPKAIINGNEVPVDIVYNSCTCVNRENPGQLFEMSINYIGIHVWYKIFGNDGKKALDAKEDIIEYLKFIQVASPKMYNYVSELLKKKPELIISLLESIRRDGRILVSQDPFSEALSIDKLAELYRRFGYIEECKVIVPQINSMGRYRYIYAKRRMIVSKQYIYRLEQYAEEKFSATALSTTNIRNENTRNTQKKYHKVNHSKTPIKVFGEMESLSLSHVGLENVIINFMIYSASPHGRRLTEALLTDDPFNIDVRLNDMAKNRNAEILNTYLRSIGLRIVFRKKKRLKKKIMKRYLNIMERTDISTGEKIEKLKIMTRVNPNQKRKILK